MNTCNNDVCEGTLCGIAGEACCPVPDGGAGDGCPGAGLNCNNGVCGP